MCYCVNKIASQPTQGWPCHLAMDQLPFFVYGTLLPGQPNDHYWGNKITQSAPATLSNVTLHSCIHYPMMIEEAGSLSQVSGRLIWVQPSAYHKIIIDIDRLEGFDSADAENSLYRRVKRKVNTDKLDKPLAWTYLGNPLSVKGLPIVPNGDWKTFVANTPDCSGNNCW